MATRSFQAPTNPVRLRRWRINVLLIVAALVVVRVMAQLVNYQVVQRTDFATRAMREIDRTITLNPQRGTIRDRGGNVLAIDVERESLYAIPGMIDEAKVPKLSLVLAKLTGLQPTDIQAKLLNHNLYWVPIKRWLESDVAEQIVALEEPGLRLIYEPRRLYPQGEYAAHVVGAANLEGVGISGVEGFYDTQLKGITGTLKAEFDPQGNPIWIDPPERKDATNGADLELTIDPFIQHVIETELKRAVDKFKPATATILVMETSTGAIRGMVSYPSFDPNRYFDYEPEVYNINPAISRVYEPGSTFKIATVAIGLESGAFTPQTQVNDSGVVERDGFLIGNWNRAGNGMIDPAQVLYYSSNVGALQLSEMTGIEQFYKKAREFGYGVPTGIDMAGEGGGIVKDPAAPGFSPVDLAVNGFGQGIAVTPMQQVRMISMIGNDGRLMRPYIVQKICHGNSCTETVPQVDGTPVSPEVAREVRDMLVTSANHYAPVVWAASTGDWGDSWLVPGYRVAAKTGTSDIPDGNGGYSGRVIGSVLGLAPADQPRYAILVKINEPEGDAYGLVSAIPTFQAIAEQLIRFERIPPDSALVGPGQQIGPVPPTP